MSATTTGPAPDVTAPGETALVGDAAVALVPARQRRFPGAPTRRLALLVLATAPLWLASGSPPGRWTAIGALVAVLFLTLFDAARTPGPSALAVSRRAPERVGLGDAEPFAYVVASAWPRAVRAALRDQLPAGVSRDGDAAPCVVVPAGGERTIDVRVTGRVRGEHALGPVALLVDSPLGLARRTVRWTGDDAMTVAPSVALVRRFRLLAVQHRLRDAGVRQVRRRGRGSTVASLREYVPGDDPRHVHWKASARRDAPVVREYAAEQGQTVMIVVDAGRLMTQLVAPGRSRFDAALESALVLADVAAQAGDRVGLLVFDDVVRAYVPAGAGAGIVGRLRDALVVVQPRLVEPDYAGAFRLLAERHRRRSLVVLFTDVIDARASRSLMAHLARGAARHLPVVVALRDDALDAAARPAGRTTPLGVYESAAAEDLLLGRDDALARMRAVGVSVLDVSAHAMSAALVNRYLELKGRGAL